MLKNAVVILVAMWISKGFIALGITLPVYIGLMVAARSSRFTFCSGYWGGF